MSNDDALPPSSIAGENLAGYSGRRVSDTSESGLESLIVRGLLTKDWLAGGSPSYDRGYCVDLEHLLAFVLATQPKLAEVFDLANDSPTRRQFLARLEKEIGTRGVIDLLRKGIPDSIDMDSYRVEKKAALKVLLPDEDAEIGPVPVSGGGRTSQPTLDRLSNTLKSFHEQFATLSTDADRIVKRIQEDIVPKIAADEPYKNAKLNRV